MDFEYDQIKDETNIANRDIPFILASQLDWDTALIWDDTRNEYGEPRQSALALYGDRLFFVAFVDRGNKRRIISMRKANKREVRYYVSQD